MRKIKLIALLLFTAFIMTARAQRVSFKNYSPKQGIKCFIELGYALGESMYSEVPISFLAVLGYQINTQWLVGIGSGYNFFTSSGTYGIPFFGDVRFNLLNKSTSPFIETKAGYSTADLKGFYCSPSIGCRFGSCDNTAFTISVGYELQTLKSSTAINYGYKNTTAMGGLNVKFGFDF